MKLLEIFEQIEHFASRGPWADKAVHIYNNQGLEDLFKYISKTKASEDLKVIKADFMANVGDFKTQDDAVDEFIEILDNVPTQLKATAGGGGGGAGGGAGGAGGGAAGGSAGGSSGGDGGAVSSGGDSGSADGGSSGDSSTTSSADSTPSDAPVSRGYIGLGSMAPYKSKSKKKKKKKKSNIQFGKGIYENVQQMEDRLSELEVALGQAREITRDIKRDDTHINILSKLGVLAEDVGLELDRYQESKVLQIHNQLESEIYELEEVFEDAIRDIKNQIEFEYDENI
jgi:hypothetical protein